MSPEPHPPDPDDPLRDPAFAQQWADVVLLTAGADEVPPCPTHIPAPASERPRLRPWMAAAAAVLVAAGVFAAVSLRPRAPQEIVAPHLLQCAASPEAPAPVDRSKIPADLATFRPVADGRIVWTLDLDRAKAVSAASGKPMLLYVFHPECPMCKTMDKKVWTDAGVLAKAAELVPVKLDVMEHMDVIGDAFERGVWPYVAVLDADGKTVREFAGLQKAAAVSGEIEQAHVDARPWDELRAAAGRLAQADAERAEGRLGAAMAYYEAARAGGAGLVALAARRGAYEIQGNACEALSSVKEIATRDADAAARAADSEAARFRGSALGDEFAAVGRALAATGKFPVLKESP